jgi:hypothetical protein
VVIAQVFLVLASAVGLVAFDCLLNVLRLVFVHDQLVIRAFCDNDIVETYDRDQATICSAIAVAVVASEDVAPTDIGGDDGSASSCFR